jgi:plastocyanin
MNQKPTTIAAVILFATLAMLGSAACGDIGDTDPTPVQTFKITPAAGATQARTPDTPQPSPTAPVAATPGARAPIAIAGISNEFDVEEVEVLAGSVTIRFDNRDGGVIHNIHFFEGDDADGESVAETDLEPGPIEQTLTFDVEPGEYFYQCDAHPTTMTGTLIVR